MKSRLAGVRTQFPGNRSDPFIRKMFSSFPRVNQRVYKNLLIWSVVWFFQALCSTGRLCSAGGYVDVRDGLRTGAGSVMIPARNVLYSGFRIDSGDRSL
jgi:hypothetical protein